MNIVNINVLGLYKYYYQDILFKKVVDEFNKQGLNNLNENTIINFILMFSGDPFEEDLTTEQIVSMWKGEYVLSLDEALIYSVNDEISDLLDDSIKHKVKKEILPFVNATNKHNQRTICIKNNLMAPEFYKLIDIYNTSIADDNLITNNEMINVPYPVCFKLPDSNGSNCFRVLYTDQELLEHIETTKESQNWQTEKKIENVIIESYVKGEEYVADFIICGTTLVPVGHWRYILGDNEGKTTSIRGAITLDNISDNIINQFQKLFQEMGLTYGFTHNEYRIDGSGNVILMEVNPRLSGCDFIYVYLKKFGVNFMSLIAYSYAKIDVPFTLLNEFIKKPIKLYYIHWAQQQISHRKTENELPDTKAIPSPKNMYSLVYIPIDIYETFNSNDDHIQLDLAASLCGNMYPSWDEWVSYCPFCVHFSSDLSIDEFNKNIIKKTQLIDELIKIK